ncbi:DUF3152 domain-containing protein [Streptomyces sp. AC627_RSS907]|uniref:DUF3152 domain-containing protein n=1 Tax=Streptomyces sp. AC627_RSS907 TaxID=2823684 RepID=UPI001C2423F2|nr:DUF3152 domain-containing protein [Streptomyces sp. AC627_RSS907]
MGRHSRRGPAPRADDANTAATRETRSGWPARRRAPGPPAGEQAPPASGRPGAAPHGAPDGTPGHRQGQTGHGQGQTGPGRRLPDEAPAHGFPRAGEGTPAQGVAGFPDGSPAHGAPQVRGGHPEQHETGGGWGELSGRTSAGYGTPAGPPKGAPAQHPGRSVQSGPPFPRQRQAPSGGPRQEYLDAFGEGGDAVGGRASRRRARLTDQPADPYASVTGRSADGGSGGSAGGGSASEADDTPPTGEPAPARGAKGRTFTGVAAAAVTTVLAVVVAGQVADGPPGEDVRTQAATDQARHARDSASRTDERPTPSAPAAPALTYEQKMGKRYPLGATLKGSGKFDAIPGIAKGPGTGRKYTYRVDVEQGLGLDGELFAEAVQKTLNDNRSWAHNGARTFERIHSGQPDFVITLASPGTTAEWCAKSGLDTTVDNVSCDSAATERVMINAYRWAQGAEPYGDELHAYRQMLINHEVGHRIGFNHVTCDKDGELAPVMQQQTKFVDHDGIDCRPNPWAYPSSDD